MSIYVVNTHKLKLHKTKCKYVQETKRMTTWDGTPNEAKEQGYTICQECVSADEMDLPGIVLSEQLNKYDETTSENVSSPDTDGTLDNTQGIEEDVPGFIMEDSFDADNNRKKDKFDHGEETNAETDADEIKSITCPKCGEQIPGGSLFCLKCGYKIKKSIPKKIVKAKKPEKETDKVNEDGYYSPILPFDEDEKYSTPVGETIGKILCAVAGMAGIILLAIYMI